MDAPLWDLARWVYGLKTGIIEVPPDKWIALIDEAIGMEEDKKYLDYRNSNDDLIYYEVDGKLRSRDMDEWLKTKTEKPY